MQILRYSYPALRLSVSCPFETQSKAKPEISRERSSPPFVKQTQNFVFSKAKEVHIYFTFMVCTDILLPPHFLNRAMGLPKPPHSQNPSREHTVNSSACSADPRGRVHPTSNRARFQQRGLMSATPGHKHPRPWNCWCDHPASPY